MQEVIERFADRIRSAAAEKTPLRLRGGGTKDFYGQALDGRRWTRAPMPASSPTNRPNW